MELFSVVSANITVPDLLAAMSGNWACFQKLHPALQRWLREKLGGDLTPEHISTLARSIVEEFRVYIREDIIPQVILHALTS